MRNSAARVYFAAVAATSQAAFAASPRASGEPSVLREPGEITQVVDAFDEGDAFDLNLSLGFESSRRSADILREDTSGMREVARYESTINRLTARAELGVFQDIALILRLPIVLSHTQELSSLDGSAARQSAVLQGLPGEQLFRIPFQSPTRSGIEYLALGVDVGLMNQTRDPARPTWVVGIEGRFDVSEPMHACNDGGEPLNRSSPQKRCTHPSDIDRNGVSSPTAGDAAAEGNFSGEPSPGVSRGVTGVELHTYLSRRVKYVEPYAGLRALFEFAGADRDFGAVDAGGSLVSHPPFRATMLVGVNVIPWEIRDRFQRVTLDFRFTGTYVSEGRDYSELFDALGSSDAPSLRLPNYSKFVANPDPSTTGAAPSVVDPSSRAVYFTGLTDIQQHGTYLLSASFTWQAGEFVKFNLGTALSLTQGHFLTFDQACDSEFDDDLSKSGYCRSPAAGGEGARSTGVPNPNYRPVVNGPGHRFRVDDSTGLDAWLNATIMF